jgi:hypothetical protein
VTALHVLPNPPSVHWTLLLPVRMIKRVGQGAKRSDEFVCPEILKGTV